MTTPSREEWAWGAGLAEGEGSFSRRQRQPHWQPRHIFQLGMTDEDVVRRFADTFGLRVYGPYLDRRPSMANAKPSWVVTVDTFELFQFLVAGFWPWLGIRRRSKIKEVLHG